MQSGAHNDILSTLLNQLWRVVAGPVLLLCIPLYLSPAEQGYWYTFASIAALSIFADLGFSTIVLQFAAHEFAYLEFCQQGTICGDEVALWRLASFFRFCLRWLLRVMGLVFPLILLGGWLFLNLNAKASSVEWHGAWLVYATMSAAVFFNAAMLSFFEGCSSVARVQKIRMLVAAANTIAMIVGLILGAGLWALAVGQLLAALAGAALLWKNFAPAMRQLYGLARGDCYDWRNEFYRLIWRYAISWSSGYFIFQLFVPIAFACFGTEYAGMVGMSIAAWTAGFNLSFTWITAIVPRINILIETKKWHELDALFQKRCWRTIATFALGSTIFFAARHIWDDMVIFQRLLPLNAMLLLCLCWGCQAWVNSVAMYLRGHKKEPLMGVSVASALYVALTTLLCAQYLPQEYLFVGFFSSYLWGMPIIYGIYRRYRQGHCILKAGGQA